jgi:hypothetical protein
MTAIFINIFLAGYIFFVLFKIYLYKYLAKATILPIKKLNF